MYIAAGHALIKLLDDLNSSKTLSSLTFCVTLYPDNNIIVAYSALIVRLYAIQTGRLLSVLLLYEASEYYKIKVSFYSLTLSVVLHLRWVSK